MLSIIDLKKADWKLIVIDINTYRKCLKILILSKKYIFNNHVKMFIKEWYDLDPKSVVGSYYDDFVIINKIIDHSIHSYNKVMEYKTR
jgi:NADH/NAD ratio-sensing transcriptional regulator Rex